MSIPNQKAALDTIKLTKADKVKLNKIIEELSDLNTELERLGIIQKYEFTQYYKGVFNIFKWIGDLLTFFN